MPDTVAADTTMMTDQYTLAPKLGRASLTGIAVRRIAFYTISVLRPIHRFSF